MSAADTAFCAIHHSLFFKKKLVLPICLALVMLGGGIAAAQKPLKRESLTLVTKTGSHKFEVEIASTRSEQARGLMFRRTMKPEQGMLFTYGDAQFVSMWMRNTYLSLDMVFILPGGRVHRVEAMTEPHSERIIESGDRVSAVLELLAGTAARIDLKAGDRILHPHF